MNSDEAYACYQELQRYVGWTDEDARRVHELGPLLKPTFPALIEDFYEVIKQHPGARKVITGGEEQIARLKVTLHNWLEQLFEGHYDADFVATRFRVGLRHVEIGLDQYYTNVALSRIRTHLLHALIERWQGAKHELDGSVESLNKLLDLDLAIIEAAYQGEYVLKREQSERLATIGQVAAGVAHELRNPLNGIKTSVYYLRHARNPSTEKTADHLERIDRQVGLADNVVTTLSDFAKLPMPKLNPAGIDGCVQQALETQPAPQGVDVVLEGLESAPPILADVSQLRIALGNLVRNAYDAMPEGGQLRISAQAEGEWVFLEISDTGIGIPEENLSRLTQPLFSTKSRGIGLGLALMRVILEKHGGGFRVASQPNEGTTFTLWLPRAAEEPG